MAPCKLTVSEGRNEPVDGHRAIEGHALAKSLLPHEITSVVCGSSMKVVQGTRCLTSERARPTSVLRLQYRRGHLFETFFVGTKPVLP